MDKCYSCPDCTEARQLAEINRRSINEIIKKVNKLITLNSEPIEYIDEVVNEKIAVYNTELSEDITNNTNLINQKISATKNYIDENVTSVNDNINNVDNKISTLETNVQNNINEINSALDNLNAFKNNGGTINGNLTVNSIQASGNLDVGVKSLSDTTGYIEITNGLVLQWGRATIEFNSQTTNYKTVVYPFAFPNCTVTFFAKPFQQRTVDCTVFELANNYAKVYGFETNKDVVNDNVEFLWFAIGY